MGNRSTPPRSFNTLRHSKSKVREKRHQQGRMVLLSICAVAVLILICALVFLICTIVNTVGGETETRPESPSGNDPGKAQAIVYQTVSKSSEDLHSGTLILVSELRDAVYTYPRITLTSRIRTSKINGINPYQISTSLGEEKLEAGTAEALNAMLTDFYKKFNDNSMILIDAYRDKERQGNFVTPVGYSEHETGYVFTLRTYNTENKEVNLTENDNYMWILDHADEYGIILRYPTEKKSVTGIDEKNLVQTTFRYVGVPHASYMYDNNLCLEEYLDLLKSDYSNEKHLQIKAADGKNYEIYYVSASAANGSIQVPSNYEYTVSGDNMEGFIVTVHLDSPIAPAA